MTLEKVLRGTVLAAVFALPFLALYVANSMFFPFITGKNFGFRILVEIAASAWVGLALLNPAYRPKRSWLLFAFAALVVVMAAADAFGVYPLKSFWSNYERMDGFVTLAHLFAYFVVAVSVLNTERLWRAWWHTSLCVAALVSFIGIFQLLGMVQINQSGTRLDARLGNATYAGVYMMFHIAIASLLLARAWASDPRNRVALAWLYGISIGLNFIVLFYTETRGAILGLAGGAVVAGFIFAFLTPDSRVRRAAMTLVAVFILLGGIAWAARGTALVHAIPPLHRAVTSFEDTSNNARLMNWAMAWQGFKERPILGWGHENYAAVFDKNYNPDMWGQEPWFDRTHSIIFDWLIAGGILGFLAYFALHFFALLTLWRSGAFAPYERAIITGLFAGYLFYLLFTFDNITSYILFASTLAYIATRASGDTVPQRTTASEGFAVGALLGAIVLAGALVWFVNADAIRQNRLLIQAIQPQTGGVSRNLELFEEASAIKSVGTQEVREQFVQAAMGVVRASDQPAELKQQFAATAAAELEKQVNDAPLNARAPFFLGVLYDSAGAHAEALPWLQEALKRSPTKQSILFQLGANAQARGEMGESLVFFKKAYESAPQYMEARVAYVSALIRAGSDAEAGPLLQQLVEDGAAATQRIAAALAERGQFGMIIEIWRAHIEQKPDDAQARFLLAVAYYESGNVAAAIKELETAKEAIPSAAAQADQFIAQMRAGE